MIKLLAKARYQLYMAPSEAFLTLLQKVTPRCPDPDVQEALEEITAAIDAGFDLYRLNQGRLFFIERAVLASYRALWDMITEMRQGTIDIGMSQSAFNRYMMEKAKTYC